MDYIRNYESMAKLNLPEEERALLQQHAEKLERRFQDVKNADTQGSEPLITVLELQNVLREDRAEQIIPRDALLQSAPEAYDGYFQVPRTID